jgi:hypothetical protein
MFFRRKQVDPRREAVQAFLAELHQHCVGRGLDVSNFPNIETGKTEALERFANSWRRHVCESFNLAESMPWGHVLHQLFYVLRPARQPGEGPGILRDHRNIFDAIRR